MHSRLTSVLTAVERLLAAEAPSTDGGVRLVARKVNFHAGVARMDISVKDASGNATPCGAINLRHFRLADGLGCLKATLSWHDTDQTVELFVYGKPGTDWASEERRIATTWAGGPPPREATPGDSDDRPEVETAKRARA